MPALPFKLNQHRRHHIPKQKHQVTNWREYDASLRQRGSLTVLCGRPERGNGFMWTAGARRRISPRLDAPIGSAWHGAATARLREAPHVRGIAGTTAPISVGERSGQLRPYVRPTSQHLPLAIMGVRVRVRRQSESVLEAHSR